MKTTTLPAITDTWKAFWPINELRPLAVLDYIAYFFLIKRLDDEQLLVESRGKENDKGLIYQQQHNELRWHVFKEMDAKGLYTLFTKENGVIDFIQRYGQSGNLYSLYLEHPLLVTPTPNLLINTLNIIKLLDTEDSDTRAAMFQALLYKQEIAGQNGQVFAPENVIKLLVAMMDPTADDVIWDPAAGNGSFLVNCLQHIKNKNLTTNNNIKQENFAGMDPDPVLQRIAAVNLMLNGIDNPALETANDQHVLPFRQQPTLIVSNLFFKASEDRLSNNGTTVRGMGRKETALLQLVMENLQPGVRAAIIIPETILYDNAEDIISIRRQIIEEHSVSAVISLSSTASLFSGAAVLLFSTIHSGDHDKIWFYKMKDVTNNANKIEESLYRQGNADGYSEEFIEAVTFWDKLNNGTLKETPGKSFFVQTDKIKANQYNLSYKEYKRPAIPVLNNNTGNAPTPPGEIAIKSIAKAHGPIINYEEAIAGEAPVKKRVGFTAILLMIIFGAAISLSFLYLINKDDNSVPVTKNAAATTGKVRTGLQIQPDTLPAIASSDNSERINNGSGKLPGKPAAISNGAATNLKKENTLPSQPDPAVSQPVADSVPAGKKYTVIQKAYFHNQPDKSTRRKGYIIHWNKAVLNPIDEKNGFIYIVYTNHMGQTSKGWLDKQDLRLIR